MAVERHNTKDDLINLKPKHASFVGIDSDGCVFDTMEIKQKQCFHTLIVSHWHLERIEKAVREAAEFVNLYSRWRGTNRFLAILKMFDLLAEHPAVKTSDVVLPRLADTRQWVAATSALGNPELEKAARETRSEELRSTLRWSTDVNALIARTVKNVPPYPWARKSLEKIHANSDAICVSQTPTEALVREWDEHDITKYVSAIAGQELGTKGQHIAMAAGGKYPSDKILMIGDALGDRKAARENRALFFPINPGRENASWEVFFQEAYDRFLAGTYAGAYEEKLIAEFEALLPETPPWMK